MLEFRVINGTNEELRSRVAVLACPPEPETQVNAGATPALGEAEAIEIWIGRWLRIRPKHLAARFGCDPKRLYEIWWGERFPGSRGKAEALFRERYPHAVDRTAFGYRRIPAVACHADTHRQLKLFE
jgi:hypothetical protein